MITEAKLDELETLAKKATRGNWSSDGCGDVWTDAEKEYCPAMQQEIFRTIGTTVSGPDPGDGAYIAAANPTTILSLISAHRKALETIEQFGLLHAADNEALRLTQDSVLELQDDVEALEAKLEKAKEVLKFYSEWESVTEDGKPRQVIVNVMYDGVPQATHALAELEEKE